MTNSTLNSWVPTTYRTVGNTITGYTTATNYIFGGATDSGTATGNYTINPFWQDATYVNADGWSPIKGFVFNPPEADIYHRNDVSEDEIDQSEELCGFLEEISE